ncbi:unnamed protein product [Triticum turgidum subsp. durum]|uniref:Uncharacterized protein n=1 Tax=Triticum turgidum subsp. durum TaxID=4567 RepID=A0A9R0XY70_TRITD|nr:unnamed protein product [Triticum turgidum subsp. durum]
MWRRGDPELRLEHGRCLLTRTRDMYALEGKLRGHALFTTVQGGRLPVSPAMLLAALESQCSVRSGDVKVEVTSPPADFFVRFRRNEDCTRVVVNYSHVLEVGGETIQFRRWHRGSFCEQSSLPFFTKLSFDGLPQEAWDRAFLGMLVNQLGGELIKCLKPDDRWCISVEAWMKDPNKVPKRYDVELSEPDEPMFCFCPESDDEISPPTPRERTEKRTVVHSIIIHVDWVVDDSPIIPEFPALRDYHDEDTTRLHTYATCNGTVDGTTPPVDQDGGRGFAGPSSQARAGALFY